MNVRETSLDAYDQLRGTGKLQQAERTVLDAVDRHFGEREFTRKELQAASGIAINAICGRVNSLVKKGELVETDRRRDGGYLLHRAPVQGALFPQ